MPHDMKGNELTVGSGVFVPAKVKAIHLTEEYCNIDLETDIAMHPSGHRTGLTLNSRQTIRKGTTEDLDLLRRARTIVDHVCKNGSATGLADAIVALAHDLRPTLDKALESDDPESQRACEAPLGRRGARDFS